MNDQGLPLRITVSLGPPLTTAGDAGADAVSARIAADVGTLMRDLGLARSPSIELATSGDETSVPIGLVVEERRCRFPQSIVAEALAYVEGTPRVAAGNDELLEGLQRLGASGPDAVAELAAAVCVAAISDQAAILAAPTDDPEVHAALGLGMSVSGQPDQPDSESSDGDDPVERYLGAAAGETIDIHVDPASLRPLTTEWARDDLFRFLREGLFAELGLSLPPFHIRPDSTLRPGGFAFRINAVRSPARIGLAPGTILVNDTAERLSPKGVAAQPTLNPASAQPASIVDAKHDAALKEAGLTTWTPGGFIILCFAAAIRRRAAALMTREVAANALMNLGFAFPVLYDAAWRHFGTDRLAQVLRELLRDGISIQNQRRIVELMLRHATDETNARGRDQRDFVRAGLGDLIAHTVSRGTTTAVVYLLDQDLERELADSVEAPGQADVDERVSAALRAELAMLPPTAAFPALLTRVEVRRRLAEDVRYEFPQTTVLSYAELPPDWNVQPVARIGAG